jgi:hypothetical protein
MEKHDQSSEYYNLQLGTPTSRQQGQFVSTLNNLNSIKNLLIEQNQIAMPTNRDPKFDNRGL